MRRQRAVGEVQHSRGSKRRRLLPSRGQSRLDADQQLIIRGAATRTREQHRQGVFGTGAASGGVGNSGKSRLRRLGLRFRRSAASMSRLRFDRADGSAGTATAAGQAAFRRTAASTCGGGGAALRSCRVSLCRSEGIGVGNNRHTASRRLGQRRGQPRGGHPARSDNECHGGYDRYKLVQRNRQRSTAEVQATPSLCGDSSIRDNHGRGCGWGCPSGWAYVGVPSASRFYRSRPTAGKQHPQPVSPCLERCADCRHSR